MINISNITKKWEMTWADLNILGLLNMSSIFIFSGFGLLAFLKYIFPNIINECFVDKIHDLKYVTFFCIVSTLIIFLISKIPIKDFIIKSSITTFVYLFGVVAICIRIFFNI